jgi:hypothetical protein
MNSLKSSRAPAAHRGLISWLIIVPCLLSANTPLPLREAVFTEVVNDVRVATAIDQPAEQAVVDGVFQTPQILMSGRRSRAQLVAPDGTITRVGSNTVFSFSESSREVFLKRGSLLFNSPDGRGGGKVVTASAVATVVGTTLIVSATSNGGFKVLVLEGKANVNFSDGTALSLNAGQMTFVLPGEKPLAVSNLPAAMREADDAPPATGVGDPIPSDVPPGSAPPADAPPAGDGTAAIPTAPPAAVPATTPVMAPAATAADAQPGPILNFDLQRQQQSSGLVQGFSAPLPSMPRIAESVASQTQAIQAGTLEGTGQVIVGATPDSVIVVTPDPDVAKDTAPSATPWARAARTKTTIGEGALPESVTFSTPVTLTAAEAPFLAGRSPYRGVVAGELDVSGASINLAAFGGSGTLDLAVETTLTLGRAVVISGAAGADVLRVSAGRLTVAAGGGLSEPVPAAGPEASTDLRLLIGSGVQLQAATFYFPRNAAVEVLDGGWSMQGGAFQVTGDLLFATTGTFAAQGALLSGEHIYLRAPNIAVQSSELRFSGGDISRIGATLEATDSIQLDNVILPSFAAVRGLEKISLSARTIALSHVNFAAGSTVVLATEAGRLAPDPNTGRPALPGHVNFIREVTYGGAPAQNYVASDKGGTGVAPARIIIQTRPPTPGG